MAEIKQAMVLAAGKGTRMRPLTDDRPKPLVEIQGRALIDHTIDRLEEAGIEKVVVNIHYMADMLEAHLEGRESPEIIFSDERDVLLETGGGVRCALPLFDDGPFFVVNSDALWLDVPGSDNTLRTMMDAYDDKGADYLMLLARREEAVGFTGKGDFEMDEAGHLSWRKGEEAADYMFAGVQIMNAALFENAPEGAFSNKWVWDAELIPHGRFVGHLLHGRWLHASSADDVLAIEEALSK